MKTDDGEDNAFELDSLVVKPKVGSTPPAAARKTSSKAAKPKRRFAIITPRHRVLLCATDRPAVAWPLFVELATWCVTNEYRKPFVLPVDHLAKEIHLDRRKQMRALRDLAKTGIVKLGHGGRYDLPVITIPGITKIRRETT